MFYCIEIADLMMSLRNQCLPYEVNKGDTFKLEEEWFVKASEVLCKPNVKHKDIKKLYKDIIVSCEYNATKETNLFSIYKEKVKANNYLHIGYVFGSSKGGIFE